MVSTIIFAVSLPALRVFFGKRHVFLHEGEVFRLEGVEAASQGVLLLLVFFVWTASFQIVEHLLPSSLVPATGSASDPAETPPEEIDFDRVAVQILWRQGRPAWRISGRSVETFADVRKTLTDVARIKNDVPLIVDAGQDVPLGHVIDVYDVARLARFQKIQFAASEEI